MVNQMQCVHLFYFQFLYLSVCWFFHIFFLFSAHCCWNHKIKFTLWLSVSALWCVCNETKSVHLCFCNKMNDFFEIKDQLPLIWMCHIAKFYSIYQFIKMVSLLKMKQREEKKILHDAKHIQVFIFFSWESNFLNFFFIFNQLHCFVSFFSYLDNDCCFFWWNSQDSKGSSTRKIVYLIVMLFALTYI